MRGMDMPPRTAYATDVSDEEWAFLAPYLTLMREDAPQRQHDLREVFNGLRFIARAGLQWRLMPHDLPPWHAVYDQTRRWLEAGVFEAIIADLRVLIRLGEGRQPAPTAVILDSRTLGSTPESGARAGWDGAKRRKGSKVHLAVETSGDLLALQVTPANDQIGPGRELAGAGQGRTGRRDLANVDQAIPRGPRAAPTRTASPWAVVPCPRSSALRVVAAPLVIERYSAAGASVGWARIRTAGRRAEGLSSHRLRDAHMEACPPC